MLHGENETFADVFDIDLGSSLIINPFLCYVKPTNKQLTSPSDDDHLNKFHRAFEAR